MPNLDWVGKRAVINHHNQVHYHLLNVNEENSVSPDKSNGNMLIHGDNLVAIKALLPHYAKMCKFIYIDPPYNTGSPNQEWIYNDNVDSPEIREWLGKTVGSEFEDLSRHDKWLCMMYPRLNLLKKLLRDDGFICVQIDDNEAARLKMIMDEIFLPSNYVTSIYVQVRYEDKTLTRDMNFHKQVEQILVYRASAKAKPKLKETEYKFDKFNYYIREKAPGRETTIGNKKVTIFNSDEYEIVKGEPSSEGLKEIWASGSILNNNSSGRFFRDYLTGRKEVDGLGVLYKVYDIGDDQFDYRYFTGPKRANAVRGKYFQGVPLEVLNVEEDQEATNVSPIPNFYDMAGDFGNCRHEGGVEFNSGKKPEKLISMLLTHFTDEGDIVVDSFAGSGSTPAVATKMKRKWIAVELGDHCFTHTLPRLKGVVNGEDQTGVTSDYNWQGGSGFDFCELGESLFDELGLIKDNVTYNDLARHIFFTETGKPLGDITGYTENFIGTNGDRIYYLLFDESGQDTFLNQEFINKMPAYDGRKRVVFANGCKVSSLVLEQNGVIFKQIPYEIKVK
ncbi:site-specific DNA-methyltransferase [Terrihalobacillus insolitus]|uniref:site-specific DNA-methyltransferase n=1 Tax=Terrihalobacillus insolitus TaxID=2950438 RepID=UPI00233FF1A2|nr:site-specific DNA-methyltransferase [Terrihalobacillus insolitus]MDC3413911.1 site-specific DNA-methyltransferase [Terrihalobacillus insolitus]